MFEVFGLVTRPTVSVVPPFIVLVPLLAAFMRSRRVALAMLAAGAVCSAALVVVLLRLPEDRAFLLWSAGVAARIGQLELTLALGLDWLAALLSTSIFVVAALLVRRHLAERRVRLLCAMACAAQITVMADGAATLVLGGAIVSALGMLVGRPTFVAFFADRFADVTLIAVAGIAFWSFGGSWVGGQYVPTLDARVVADGVDRSSLEQSAPRSGGATLSLTSLPGAAVLVDGSWVANRSSITRAPFDAAPIQPGSHTIRVHVGAGSDDYYIPRVDAVAGERVALAVRGATTTFREAQDDRRMRATTDAARSPPRRFFGTVATSTLLLFLAMAAFAFRVRLYPLVGSEDGAHSLTGISALIIVARYGPLSGAAVRPTAAIMSGVLFAATVGWLGAIVRGGARRVLASELAVAAVAMLAGASALGVLHGAIAAVAFHRLGWPTRAGIWSLLPTRLAIIVVVFGLPYGALPTALGFVMVALSVSATTTRARALVAGSWVARLLDSAPQTIAGALVAVGRATVHALAELEQTTRVIARVIARCVAALGDALYFAEDAVLRTSRVRLSSAGLLRIFLVPVALCATVMFTLPWLR
jgi:hypothetical protein